jgi:hypothetical protein
LSLSLWLSRHFLNKGKALTHNWGWKDTPADRTEVTEGPSVAWDHQLDSPYLYNAFSNMHLYSCMPWFGTCSKGTSMNSTLKIALNIETSEYDY